MSLLWPIAANALKHANRTAVIDDQRTYTYGKLLGAAMYLAEAVDAATDNEHVGILLPTSGAFPIATLGCWLARRTVVPLNYLLNPAELQHVMHDSGIDRIITVGPMLDYLGREQIPEHIDLLRLDELDFSGVPPLRWPPLLGDDEPAAILYTSGTSGKPKGVMLSHGNLHANVRGAAEHCGFRQEVRFFGVLPQFHSFGFTALTLLPLYLGSDVIYTARFMPRRIVKLIAEHRPDVMLAVPSMYGALLTAKDADADDFASLKFCVSGGEPLPDATRRRAEDRFGIRILEGYGLTETSPITNWSTPEHHRDHAVGKALPRVHEVVVDEKNNVLPPNTEGEILIAGPNIMKGYYRLPDQTDQVFVDLMVRARHGENKTRRFFRTGDIGKIDEDGYLYITGRKKEMLIISGENVFPREIEEVLNKHESIKDSAVIGKPDDVRGEVPVAFVELNDSHELDAKALQAHCRDALAPFKIPKDIRAIDELPRSPTGKILRRRLEL